METSAPEAISLELGFADLTQAKCFQRHAQQLVLKGRFVFREAVPGIPVNKETAPELHRALEDFKKAVTSANITPAYFDSPDRLQTELLLAMGNWNAQGRPGARLVFTTPSEFFAPFESGAPRLFDFKQTLRDRDAQLQALNAFLTDPTSIVGVLTGRGGIGKSKLLHGHPAAVESEF